MKEKILNSCITQNTIDDIFRIDFNEEFTCGKCGGKYDYLLTIDVTDSMNLFDNFKISKAEKKRNERKAKLDEIFDGEL